MTTMYNFHRVLATGTAGTALTAKTVTSTKPATGTGIHVVDLLANATAYAVGKNVPKYVDVVPIVGDANDETGTFRLWGWNRFEPSGTSGTIWWVPKLLVHCVATATNAASAAGVDAATTPFFCDTIAVSYGDSDASVISPTNDVVASVLVHLRGAELLEIDWAVGTGANQNFLYRFVDQ